MGDRCTGCETCVAVCPRKSIHMALNSGGFFFPAVDFNKCNGCCLCDKKCPVLNPKKRDPPAEQSVYAVWSKNADVRRESSSGGAFSILAQYILQRRGIVFGAAFDDGMELFHTAVHSEAGLKKLRGSKYIQSHTAEAFRETKKFLNQGKLVLFCGTPCQIDGLCRFLDNKTEGLYTIDLLCHGVCSNRAFQRYLKYYEKKRNQKIVDARFRDKSNGWRVPTFVFSYHDGCEIKQKTRDNLFLSLMFTDLATRLSCYNCRFTCRTRTGDISIGDYWGIEEQHPEIKATHKGVSLVLINSEKGRMLFENAKGSMEVRESVLSKAIYGNRALEKSCRKNIFREVTLFFLNTAGFPLSGSAAHAFILMTKLIRKIIKE